MAQPPSFRPSRTPAGFIAFITTIQLNHHGFSKKETEDENQQA
jgi:hypothetical protein